MATKQKAKEACPACVGKGSVCCQTWAYACLNGDQDFNELGIPLWPLISDLELAFCPFCGKRFEKNKSVDKLKANLAPWLPT